ncbi:uncharacterized protein LOC124361230 [Homalodisca vitripennis]|uniref:uncharacterized protein LOC124361230 n=1 Tax=Homalodisca vitripennis TaxID=197043 RepID=UPI001EEAC158|nr:uncharacterized protein LOC124361230 [Homalodisca vitripennis]
MPVLSRLQSVKDLGLCINCLSHTYIIKDCKSNGCKTCSKKHNTLLHLQKDHSNSKNLNFESRKVNGHPAALTSNVTDKHILLSTAVVDIENNNGGTTACRVLLDSASQSNFITERMVRALNLQKVRSNIQITGIGNRQASISHVVYCTIHSQHSAYKTTLSCLILPKITNDLPHTQIDTSNWNLPSTMTLADFNFNSPGPIDMLIGAELFFSLLCVGQVRPHRSAPIFQKTSLGWVASGRVATRKQQPTLTCNLSIDDQVTRHVQRFWEIEDCDVHTSPASQTTTFERMHTETTYRDSTGKYVVNLPCSDDINSLGESKKTAESRFSQLERKLERDPNLHAAYSQFMNEYEALGHMEAVEPNVKPVGPVYYIPHLPVVREDSSTTKLRVVFDASAKTSSGRSLNDCLLVGPTIQQDVFSILARFRYHTFVLSADIEKMYRQVYINEKQLDLQRILWRQGRDQPLKVYRLKTVTYGTAAAPFLAIRTLHQLATDERSTYPIASSIALSDFYVDDLMTGAKTLEDAKVIQTQMSQMLNSGGFNLRKWNSNSKELLETIPDKNRAEQEHYMREDYNRLREGKKIRKDSPLWNLQSFFGPEKLIRVGGRLKHAKIKIDQKHPIVLPYKSHLTELIFRHEHIRLLHAAPQLLLASLRQRYWPLNGRNLARRTTHSCVKCFKANPKTTQPQMGDLPSDRVRPCRPFSNTGTDISGPVFIKASKRRNSPTSKGYIVIFVCLATKAVHLEVVTDMTSEAFIAAFKRFISRRGIVTNMYSDNGTNFVGAERELRELQDLFTNEEHQRRIVEESTAHLIKWHFIPP